MTRFIAMQPVSSSVPPGARTDAAGFDGGCDEEEGGLPLLPTTLIAAVVSLLLTSEPGLLTPGNGVAT